MKTTLLLIVLTFLLNTQQAFSFDGNVNINPIIGDASFSYFYKQQPNFFTNENERIQTHLKYVELILRNKNVSNLNSSLLNNRKKMLDYLHNYWEANKFPVNEKYTNKRTPCFIDNNGTICAVGYLVEQSAGRKTAEYINNKFQYNFINEMQDATLTNWITNSGLTKEEYAMIQPSYYPSPSPNNNYILSKKEAITTGIFSGLNTTTIILNASQFNKIYSKRASSIIGIVGGLSQLIYGIDKYPIVQTSWYGESFMNSAERNVSLLNIGLGSTSVIMGVCNLIVHKKPKDKKTSFNLYSTPAINNSIAYGFRLNKKLG